MRILVACEFSGIVRQEFDKLGHNAWSCDLKDTEIPGKHLKCDVTDVLNDSWDMIIASPPSNNIELMIKIWEADCDRIAMDNPPGRISRFIGAPQQTLNPWMYNDFPLTVSCLWLKNLPLLEPDNRPGMVNRIIRPSKTKMVDPKDLLRMSASVARAMAKAWGRDDSQKT